MFSCVALLDMDSYFASIECAKNPILKNYPVAVIGNGEKTAVTSANNIAKACGVKAGMNLKEAKRSCPNVIFVKADFNYYEFTTLKIVQLIEKYFYIYKEASIDEFYIALNDMYDVERLRDLKNEIKERLDLNCTIGVGRNPVIAKTACEVAKPNGFSVVEDFEEFSKQVDISNVPGIGKRSLELLRKVGVETLWDFLNRKDVPFDNLKAIINKKYTEKEFFKFVPPKSMGHHIILDKDLYSLEEVLEVGKYLLFAIYSKLIRHKMAAKSISVYLKDSFGVFSTSRSFGVYTNDFVVISKTAENLYKLIYNKRPVVKIGISLNNLKMVDGFQQNLFWKEELEKFKRLANFDKVSFAGFYVLKEKKVLEH
ncbi:MAG: hypothetical protein ACP5PP_08135 [Fervidobacterium sp.]